jgi:N-acetyl sugar amidotransferase
MMNGSCARCILDSTFPHISFDAQGICNYCHSYNKSDKKFPLEPATEKRLMNIVEKIQKEGRNKEYDCIQGVSGGRDSTYCLYLLKQWGLRPLAVHYDNNMDSKIAADNIKNACRKLDIDLHTFVVDWEEFKDLQRSFFKASVPSVDVPTDHAFSTVLYNFTYDNEIKYIFSGAAFRTEGYIPRDWSLNGDEKFIHDIHKKFGTIPLKNFPIRHFSDLLRYRKAGITVIQPLNYITYEYHHTMPILENELGWQYYGGHHFESIFTRWAFAYYLPKKFGIDKRGTDYSVLIRSRQMTREDALMKMKESIYSPEQEREDRRYIMNKLDLAPDEMDSIVQAPPKSNYEYAHISNYERILRNVLGPRHL